MSYQGIIWVLPLAGQHVHRKLQLVWPVGAMRTKVLLKSRSRAACWSLQGDRWRDSGGQRCALMWWLSARGRGCCLLLVLLVLLSLCSLSRGFLECWNLLVACGQTVASASNFNLVLFFRLSTVVFFHPVHRKLLSSVWSPL